MTLVFLGAVAKDELLNYQNAATAIHARAFKMTLDQAGCFARAQVLWLGTSRESQPLQALVSALNKELEGYGFQPENKPFVSHVTLARKYRQERAISMPVAIDWQVNDFALVESRSTSKGVSYHVLQSWPLLA